MALHHRSSKSSRTTKRGSRMFQLMLAALAGAGIWDLYRRQKQNNRVLYIGGYAWSHVTSGSMEPAVMTHDVVLIHRQPDYAVGDVVIYRRVRDGELVIHRIIEKDGTAFVTKGDANDHPDVPITLADIQGKMIAKTHHGSGLLRFFSSPAGFALLSGALVLSCLPARSKKN